MISLIETRQNMLTLTAVVLAPILNNLPTGPPDAMSQTGREKGKQLHHKSVSNLPRHIHNC
ncbi:hypothetical protein NQZ68_016634 [Dissostichus eleginoides]|nr:hypothetical protein NQZ68_016634 [Dissostichus eleginoides]